MKPQNINSIVLAMSPEELYLKKPYNIPFPKDYSTSTVNLMTPPAYEKLSAPRGTTMFSTENSPKYGLKSINEIADNYERSGFPREKVPQAIYEHELAHALETRLLPISGKSSLGRRSSKEEIRVRENPADIAEKRFWELTKGKKGRYEEVK